MRLRPPHGTLWAVQIQPTTDSAVVRASDLSLVYPNDLRALEGIQFSLNPHEFVSIVGPSGCGKSSLLKLIAGLLRPTGGECRIATQDGGQPLPIGYVFQSPTLLPWRTVRDNVALPFELGDATQAPPAGHIDTLIRLVGLQDFDASRPHQLSGGMQMRVALARALATKPGLLLLDEPFGALDEITRQRLNEDLLSLWTRDAWTALFITHNVFEAVFLSQRVLVMSGRPGHIAATFDIPFPYPRSPNLRADAAFALIAGEISAKLREVST